MRLTRGQLLRVYRNLHDIYGPQYWWRARTHFEMMAGAVLVQNTNWQHAARPAVFALRRAKRLSPAKIAALPTASLAKLIRSSGTHGVKARRLKALADWVLEQGGVARARRLDTEALRRSLLAVHGIGPETADCILLYVFDRPVFVADAYARRFLGRLGMKFKAADYEAARQEVQAMLPADTAVYNEFHALIVRHSKVLCRATPLCERCSLRRACVYGRSAGNHRGR